MISSMLAHHVAIEILGKEYEPHGVFQHAMAFGGTLLVLGLAGVGFVTVCRWVGERRRQSVEQRAK